MSRWHGELGKKRTGATIHPHRKKRKFELGGLPIHTSVGKAKKKFAKTKGGGIKVKAAVIELVNVYDPKSGKMQRTKILDLVKNPANPHFIRRGILTKGSVVKTDLGLVRITSRPSQSGVASAIIVEEEK